VVQREFGLIAHCVAVRGSIETDDELGIGRVGVGRVDSQGLEQVVEGVDECMKRYFDAEDYSSKVEQ
jgi:hypothetical protein